MCVMNKPGYYVARA